MEKADGRWTNITNHKNAFSREEFHPNACTVDSACRVVTEAETPYDETTLRPLAGSVAIDAGDTSYYVIVTNTAVWRRPAWLAEVTKDYYGNDRVVNGRIDVGCGEAQCSDIIVEDSSGGLVIEGVDAGTTRLPDDSSIDVVFSRNFTSDRLCTGVKVNGEFHSFGGTTSDVPYSVTFLAALGRNYNVEAIYEESQKDWYVSPTGNNENKGYHRNCPRRTLDKAMELAMENAGHVVHAAAGIYDSFAEGEEYASANSRVTVKEGVGLVADEWPLHETVIKGASDEISEGRDDYGNGPKAVRCVTVEKNGYVRGFKLTDGRTDNTPDAKMTRTCGGGAYLKESAALIDCEITGNGTGYRGSVVYSPDSYGWLIRCYVHDNHQNGGNYQILDRTSIVDCYVDGGNDSAYYCRGNSIILNSTIVKGSARSWNNLNAYNSYIDAAVHTGGKFTLYNCALMETRKTKFDGVEIAADDACIFNVAEADNLGDDYRPKTAMSPLVDAGVNNYYDTYFPAQFAQFKNDRDFAGGQRVYNGKIDIGCGEYDFRGDFASLLGSRTVISEMGPNVTTNTARNIVVPEGESIAVSMAPRASDRNTQYELVYTPDGGSQTVVAEKSTDAFTYTLDGACTVQSLNGYLGFVFQIR